MGGLEQHKYILSGPVQEVLSLGTGKSDMPAPSTNPHGQCWVPAAEVHDVEPWLTSPRDTATAASEKSHTKYKQTCCPKVHPVLEMEY